jgi:UrcA family protein
LIQSRRGRIAGTDGQRFERLPETKESNMTTSTRITHPRILITAATLTALISTFSAVCAAAGAADAPQAVVKFADLDVSTSQGAAALYTRIRAASEQVCSPLDHGDFAASFRWQKCVKQAIEGAVAKVNQPALSAVYAARYGDLQPAKILTADRR